MFFGVQLFNAFVEYRADVCLALLAGAAVCGAIKARAWKRRSDVTLPADRCAAAMGPVILAIAAAELATAFAWVSGGSLEVMRSVVLVAGVAVSIVLLVAELRCERLRAELRRHAGVGQQLQQAKTAADEASRVKSDFLAVMSHEMRTPLNAVTGFATLLRETRLDDAQRDYVRTIAGEAARLTSLINDILDLTKIEEGRLTLERLPFAPVETGQEVLRLLQNRAAEQKLDLRFEPLLTSPLLVAGDPLRFRQVLLNLIDNAVKFTARGSVTLYLSWKPPAEPGETGELGVTVKDTGIGIPASKLNNLFQMFMQVDTSTTRRYGGTGLGLAICQRLVRLMGGEISVRSTVGEGSEFSFSLPVTAVAAPVATVEIDPPPAPASSRRPRVLVVDDMETNRFLLEIFLRRHGFDPDVASGGEEAIALAAKKPYDAILMDLQMPDLDGYTAARRIREAETGGQHTPILALTASIAKGTRDKCLAAGMDEHLTKPLDLRRFKELLDGYITTRTKPNPARHGPAHTARC